MAGHGDPDLLAGLLEDLVRQLVGDGGVLAVFLLGLVLLLAQGRILLGNGALRHCQDGEALARLVPLVNGLDDLVHVVGDFRQQNDVGAAGHTGEQGEPAHLVAHDLHDEHPAVGGGGGVDAVDGVGGDLHSAVEAEGHVGAPDVVIDGLGQGDHVEALLPQQVGGLVGTVAAQYHQTVQIQGLVVLLHGRHLVQTVGIGDAHLLEGLPGGAQDGAALGQDAGEIPGGELMVVAVNEPLVALLKTVNLHVRVFAQGFDHAPHGCVQGLAVAAAGEHSDFQHIVRSFLS